MKVVDSSVLGPSSKNVGDPYKPRALLLSSSLRSADIKRVDKEPATVLLVEDHDSVRIAITRFLKAGGFHVLDAATPESARTFWTKYANRIALLLVDIDLI